MEFNTLQELADSSIVAAPVSRELPKIMFRGVLMTGPEAQALKPVEIGPSFELRRAAIGTAMHSMNVKDRNKYLATKRKKLGAAIVDAYMAQLWPTQNASCQAVRENDMDKGASAANGWQSMEEIRAASLAFWREYNAAWDEFNQKNA